MLTDCAQGKLGPSGQMLFFVGDGLQRAMADAVFGAFRPGAWTPANMVRLGSRLAHQSRTLTRLLAPDQARLMWQELKNKIEVFQLVRNLSSILHLPENEFITLPDLVHKAYDLSPYEALWAVEGVGHYYADKEWERHGPPVNLLAGANEHVPEKSLLMLHAGMGLCFADRLVRGLDPASTPGEVQEALEHFVALCRANSRPGYLGAALESLGIVTRDFHPELLRIITRHFRLVAPQEIDYYWHGIGRAIYFSRKFFIPHLFSMWGDARMEPATDHDRLSTTAGLAWAFTLVNMRHPQIVKTALTPQNEDAPIVKAFMNGVSSCVVMRWATTPGAPFVQEFCRHYAATSEGETTNERALSAAWAFEISKPTRAAIQAYYPVLTRHRALDQVFRYTDLAHLVEELQRPSQATGDLSREGTCGCCEPGSGGTSQ
jgi:hypothetical protein